LPRKAGETQPTFVDVGGKDEVEGVVIENEHSTPTKASE